MTTRNFRVNNGLEVGDITISANANTITGGATAAPNADGQFANKKYVDDQISAVSTTAITSGSTNITVSGTAAVATIGGATELTITGDGVRVHGNLTVDGTETILNTTTLSVEDNLIEVNRNISTNAATPNVSGIQVNRGAGSTATDKALLWAWDETFADDGTTIHGNVGGAFTAFARERSGSQTPTTDDLVDIRANVVHALSTSAQYADVAERFAADAPMAEGAVVMLGGAQEITETDSEMTDTVFGVISTMPAYAMNTGAGNNESHPFVAMTGRTPVRVTGQVSKGQRLVSSNVKGTARAVSNTDSINPFHVIGRALEDKTTDGIGLVNCVVRTNN
tara:strand:- start:59 stop:1072 length:1014 start_codon:yes stop_codon:yes gene_type:complete